MNIAFIGCMVLSREVCAEIAQSPNAIRTWWLRQGLHDTPERLRSALQEQILLVEKEQRSLDERKKFDCVCLGYGLCSNGIIGLRSHTLPIVVPRSDDCISLFLGSAAFYRTLFHRYPGAYWYTNGWIDQAFTPSTENYQRMRERYAARYGEDNAAFLMEHETAWAKNYKHCVYIDNGVYSDPKYAAYAKQAAKAFHWTYHEARGSTVLIRKLLNGPWSDDEFLLCPPGFRIRPAFSDKKIEAEPLPHDQAPESSM